MKIIFIITGFILFIFTSLLSLLSEKLNILHLYFFLIGNLSLFIGIFHTTIISNLNKHFGLKVILLLPVLIFSFLFLVLEFFVAFPKKIKYIPKDVDYILILGTTTFNDKPSEILKYRLDNALKYINKYCNSTVIVSGSSNRNNHVSEAMIMKDYLVNNGLIENKIIIDDGATSTYENIVCSKKLINFKKNKTSILLITSSFHLYRSNFIAQKEGFVTYPIGSTIPFRHTFITHLKENLSIIKCLLIYK